MLFWMVHTEIIKKTPMSFFVLLLLDTEHCSTATVKKLKNQSIHLDLTKSQLPLLNKARELIKKNEDIAFWLCKYQLLL